MSEKMVPQSEDPLPLVSEASYTYDTTVPGTLGEIVVTDPRDPFVWLSTIPLGVISENAKKVMWAIYRMNGNFPEDDSIGKVRDQEDIEGLFGKLSELDEVYIIAYQKHLVQLL